MCGHRRGLHSIDQNGVNHTPASRLANPLSGSRLRRNPIRALRAGDLQVINRITGDPFGDGGEGGGVSSPSTPSSYGLFTLLSLDMSGSVFERNAQGGVFDAAEQFIRTMVDDVPPSLRPKIAIQVFGRTAETRIVQDFTSNLTQLIGTLDTLRANQAPLGSTNLYGAYRAAVDAVVAQGRSQRLPNAQWSSLPMAPIKPAT